MWQRITSTLPTWRYHRFFYGMIFRQTTSHTHNDSRSLGSLMLYKVTRQRSWAKFQPNSLKHLAQPGGIGWSATGLPSSRCFLISGDPPAQNIWLLWWYNMNIVCTQYIYICTYIYIYIHIDIIYLYYSYTHILILYVYITKDNWYHIQLHSLVQAYIYCTIHI